MVEIKEGSEVVLTEKFDVCKDALWKEDWLEKGDVLEVTSVDFPKPEFKVEIEDDHDFISGVGVLPVVPLEKANVAVVTKEFTYEDTVFEEGAIFNISEKSINPKSGKLTAELILSVGGLFTIDGIVDYTEHFVYAYDNSVDSDYTMEVEEVMETKTESKFEEGMLVYVKGNEGGAIIDVGEFALVRFNDNSDWMPVSLINKAEEDPDNNWFSVDDLVEVNESNFHTVTGETLTEEESYDKIVSDVGLELLEEYGHPLVREITEYLYPLAKDVREWVEAKEEVVKDDTIVDDDTVLRMSSKELVAKVEEWAVARNLHTAEPSKQYLKLVEEVGETVDAMWHGNVLAVTDGLGDVAVVAIIMSLQLGINTDFIATTIDTLDYLEKTFDIEECEYRLSTKLTISLGKVAEDLAKGRDVQEGLINVLSDLVILRHLKVYESLLLRKSLAVAYNEIKHRKGKLVDGVFIKEEDLK